MTTPEGWLYSNIENACSAIFDCEHKTAPYVEQSEFLVVRTNNVKGGRLDFIDIKYTTASGYNEWTKRTIPKYGDILFTREAPAGESCLVPEKLNVCMGQRMVLLRPDPKKTDFRFLSHYLSSPFLKADIHKLQIGTTVSRINIHEIKKIRCPLPPLLEQRKIAEILSCWDRAIENYDQLIERTTFSFRRLIREFLGDGRKRINSFIEVAIDNCCDILDTQRKPLNKEQRNDERGKIPYYGANGKVGAVDDWIFDEPLILIAEDGGYFDEYKTRPIAYRIEGKSWVNNHAHVLKAKPHFDQNCIFFCLVHKDISQFLNGGTRAKLNRKELEKIVIQLPRTLKEQQLVGATLDSICNELSLLNGILEKIRLEKQALMQKLLTGKIRLRV